MTDMRGLENALVDAVGAVEDIQALVWNTSENPAQEWGNLLYRLTGAHTAMVYAYDAFLDRRDEMEEEEGW